MIKMVCVPAAEAVGGAVLHGQTVVDDVVRVALIDHVPLHGAFDAVVQRCRIRLGIQEDPPGWTVVVVVVGLFERLDRPLLPAADFAVVEDDVAHVDVERIVDVRCDDVQTAKLELEEGTLRQNAAQVDVQIAFCRGCAHLEHGFEVLPLGRDIASHDG